MSVSACCCTQSKVHCGVRFKRHILPLTPHPKNMVVVPTLIMQDHALDKVPTLVGPKVVLLRLGYKLFWERMSTMFHLCIWSFMKESIVDLVVEYLFAGMPKPAIVLGQEDCTSFKDMWDNVVMNPLKPQSPLFFEKFVIQVLVATYLL